MSDDWKFFFGLLIIAAIAAVVLRYPGILAAFVNKATARCRDGTLSFSANACGTCSHHGGVKEWLPA